jgi:predicted nucleotidyltransferase
VASAFISGSVALDERPKVLIGPDSDIDVLVEFEPEHVPGLGVITMERAFSEIFGGCVDLVTPKLLSHRIRDQVLNGAGTVYANGPNGFTPAW